MSFKTLIKQKRIKPTIFALVMLACFGLANFAQAQSAGDFLLGAGKIIGAPAMLIPAAILWALQGLLTWVVQVTGWLMETMLSYNVLYSPVTFEPVTRGWQILRDIANSILILFILWIALSIIFSFGNWRRALIRVIMVALLINFSLAIVTGVFAFSNVIASAFFNSLPRNTNGGLGVDEYVLSAVRAGKIFTPIKNPPPPGTPLGTTVNNATGITGGSPASLYAYGQPKDTAASLLASVGIANEADAALPLILLIPAVLGIAAAIGGLMMTLGNIYGVVLSLVTTNIFLLIISAAFITVSFYLLMRLIAIVFLSILAPVALALYALPGSTGEGMFKKWLDALLRWSFFAPIFFFLFYISLLMMGQGFNFTQGDGSNAADRPDIFMLHVVAAAFMIASVVISKKVAGHSADAAFGYFKKAAGLATGLAIGAATGGTALALRAMPAATESMARGARRIPLAGRAISQKIEQPVREERKDVENRKQELKNWSDQQLKDVHTSRMASGRDKAAALGILADRGKLDHIQGREKESLQLAKRYGQERSLLNRRPDLATEEFVPASEGRPIKSTVMKLRGDGLREMDTNAIRGDGAQQKEVRDTIFINSSFSPSVAAGWAQKSQDGFEAVQELKKHFEKITANKQQYFASNNFNEQEKMIFNQQEKAYKEYFEGNLMAGNRRKKGKTSGQSTAESTSTVKPESFIT